MAPSCPCHRSLRQGKARYLPTLCTYRMSRYGTRRQTREGRRWRPVVTNCWPSQSPLGRDPWHGSRRSLASGQCPPCPVVCALSLHSNGGNGAPSSEAARSARQPKEATRERETAPSSQTHPIHGDDAEWLGDDAGWTQLVQRRKNKKGLGRGGQRREEEKAGKKKGSPPLRNSHYIKESWTLPYLRALCPSPPVILLPQREAFLEGQLNRMPYLNTRLDT